MKKFNQNIALSLGGSIVVPGEIQVEFLKKFKSFVLKNIKAGRRFIIVVGGGKTCRNYIKAAAKVSNISDEDRDWIGIHATRLNAHLIRTIFKKIAYPVVLVNPLKQIEKGEYPLFIGSGWRPGWSTDYDTVLLANRFNADKVINVSNIDYVYDKDIAKYKNAKPIRDMCWSEYQKLIGSKWKPGMSAPVDPIAAKLASKLRMTIIVTKGTDLKNLQNILDNKKFKGTILHS